MQKRLVRKLDLEKALSEIKPHQKPRAYLEQYTIPPEAAAEILYIAAYTYDDIVDKAIVDLGCGTGRLAIGAVLVGAKEVLGVDIDPVAVKMAHNNAEKMGVKEKTQWILADIDVVNGSFDTVLQNPPFGVQRKGADRKFLEKSLELGRRVYSLHKSGKSNRQFIKRFIDQRGGKVTGVFPMEIEIPRLFKFHTKRKHSVKTDLYRIEGKGHD
ncbi:methyltransferase [Candidatus Bathyarchaeota archaeon]|nr:methyltransferase [Candidatus Bathyarchaeota archaeon]